MSKPTDVPESKNCQHDLTISIVVEGQSDMRECVDCHTTFSGRELAIERMRQNLESVAEDVAGWSETKKANAEAIMYPENRLNPPLASPVAGGSARIAEIRQRVEVARISDSALTNTLADDLEYLLKLVPEGWVKVTPETMPPECTVIVCDTSRVVHIAVYRPKSDEYRWDCDTYGLHASDVTHWRPFPVPPAAEEERSSL